VLCLAEALSQRADVTVAFRSVLEPITPKDYDVVEIEPGACRLSHRVDDSAVRGIGLGEFAIYLRALRRFAEEQLHSYDIVLEKSWLLSGYVVARCQRRGLPGVVIENIVRVWNEPLRNPHACVRYLWHQLAQILVGHYLRQAPLIIAETAELKTALSNRWAIPPRRIEVIGLGVDHNVFRPLDQAQARGELGISPDRTILLYVGVLDQTHSLIPLLDALYRVPDPALELHIVGDGVLKEHYRQKVERPRTRVFFHGRVPHGMVPQFIAAADLCLAPYDLAVFPNGQVAYSTLKIPEYMACARPVASVPSGHILNLIHNNVTGFLFHNDAQNWVSFLTKCPSREALQEMGRMAASLVSAYSWEATSDAYFSLCEQLISRKYNTHATLSYRNIITKK
jgi:glycosyltransferase involved in cell wall biosynthesis